MFLSSLEIYLYYYSLMVTDIYREISWNSVPFHPQFFLLFCHVSSPENLIIFGSNEQLAPSFCILGNYIEWCSTALRVESEPLPHNGNERNESIMQRNSNSSQFHVALLGGARGTKLFIFLLLLQKNTPRLSFGSIYKLYHLINIVVNYDTICCAIPLSNCQSILVQRHQ